MTAGLPVTPKRGRPSRREPIFESALRLFRERGFHATAINDIGADAGVTGPAIYAHFESKGEVLAEAIREGCRRIGSALEEALVDDDLSAQEQLERRYGFTVQLKFRSGLSTRLMIVRVVSR